MGTEREIKKIRKLIRETLEISYPISDPPMYGDSDYEKRGGKIIKITPKTYLSLVPILKMDEDSIENIEHIKSHIKSNKEIDPPTLYVDGNAIINHDGRHRAHAAMQLGIKKIPVLIIDKNQKEPLSIKKYIKETEKNTFKEKEWFTSKISDDINENVGPGPYDVRNVSDIYLDLYNKYFNSSEFVKDYDPEKGVFIYNDEHKKKVGKNFYKNKFIKNKSKDYRKLKRKMNWKNF